MDLDVLLGALVLVILPALAQPVRRAQSPVPWDSEASGSVSVAPSRWPRWRAGLHEFWNQQLHLQQLYLSSFDSSGGDALAAVARRKPSVSAPD